MDKKNVLFCFVLFFLLFSLILMVQAENVSEKEILEEIDKNTIIQENDVDVPEFNISEEKTKIIEKTDIFLKKELNLSQRNKEIFKYFFGIQEEEKIFLNQIIVFFIIYLGIIILLKDILSFFNFFNTGKLIIISIIVTMIIGTTGILYEFTLFLFALFKPFLSLRDLNIIWVFLFVIFIFFIRYILKKIKKIIDEEMKKEKAERHGINLGMILRKLKITKGN